MTVKEFTAEELDILERYAAEAATEPGSYKAVLHRDDFLALIAMAHKSKELAIIQNYLRPLTVEKRIMKDKEYSIDLTDEELLCRAVTSNFNSNFNGETHRLPRWSHVRNIFGLGSGYATMLCRRFDADPDEILGGCPDCEESYYQQCDCDDNNYEEN